MDQYYSASDLIFLAKISQTGNRYHEMVKYISQFVILVSPDCILDNNQRYLLSIAFKQIVGPLRTSLRYISGIKTKSLDERYIKIVNDYYSSLLGKIKKICHKLIDLVSVYILPPLYNRYYDNNTNLIEDIENLVFYEKMLSDYYRYYVEFDLNDSVALSNVTKHYEKASTIAQRQERKLLSYHPIRLCLILNYSVFHYDIKKSPSQACQLAKEAFDENINCLQKNYQYYNESSLILQLLREYLIEWIENREPVSKLNEK